MVKNRIAIIDGGIDYLRPVSEIFVKDGIYCHRSYSAVEALDRLNNNKMDAIITNLALPPLTSHNSSRNYSARYPEIGRVMSKSRESLTSPDYSEITMQMIKELRRSDSKNKETPIFVSGSCPSEGNETFPNIEQRSLEAGANMYFMIERREDFDLLVYITNSTIEINRESSS